MSKLELIKDSLNSLKLSCTKDMEMKPIVEELLEYVIQLEQECISLLQNRNQEKMNKSVQPELSWSTLRSDRLPLKINMLADHQEV